ncbi:MAG: glycosyltransferase family 9 protein [Chloroflexi bacterium]|nr:glycosyltransferase family 9 protein [Chloroflexota bacterium]
MYRLLAPLFPRRAPPAAVRRLLLVLPCCIGDVVLATATLQALRRAYPQAHITWAVGSWSKGVLEGHPLLDALLDTGAAALPVKTPRGLWQFVRQVRAGRYDLAVSLVRSPLMSAALWLAGVPYRAGPDSGGRGFAYNIRAPIDPLLPRHEAEVYLDVARALNIPGEGWRAYVPVQDTARAAALAHLARFGLENTPLIVLNPAGGQNPGMTLDSKRWPPPYFAELGARLAHKTGAALLLLAGPKDAALVDGVWRHLPAALIAQGRAQRLDGALSFAESAALAARALLYIGNDTGLTHLAAAAGAKTVMILGPTDPARYAPFADNAIALWKPALVARAGVAAGAPRDWDWARDGISVDAAESAVLEFLAWQA